MKEKEQNPLERELMSIIEVLKHALRIKKESEED